MIPRRLPALAKAPGRMGRVRILTNGAGVPMLALAGRKRTGLEGSH